MRSGHYETIGAPVRLRIDYEVLTLGELSNILRRWQVLLRSAWKDNWLQRHGPEPPYVRVFTSTINSGSPIDLLSDFALPLSIITAVFGPVIDWPSRGREAIDFLSQRLRQQRELENDRIYLELGERPVMDFPARVTERTENTDNLIRIIEAARSGNFSLTIGEVNLVNDRTDLREIETGFHAEMLRIYREATEFGYYPNYFLQVVNERGGLSAAKHLLHTPEPSSGFARLWEAGRLDLSVEAVAVREPWSALFSDEELTIARQRLADLGFDPFGRV